MPMPDPTGDTGQDHFFNIRRLLALLALLVLILLATVAWLAFTIASMKRERDNAGIRVPIEASGRPSAVPRIGVRLGHESR